MCIRDSKKPDGFKESPIIEYDTLFKTYKFKIYASFIAGSAPEQDNGYPTTILN